MEALSRIRLLIWLLLISLWALMVYQYLGQGSGTMSWPLLSEFQSAASPLSQVSTTGNFIDNENRNPFPQPPQQPDNTSPDTAELPSPPPGAVGVAAPASPQTAAPNPEPVSENANPAPAVAPAAQSGSGENISRPIDIPPGFTKTIISHFVIYSENGPPSRAFLNMAELLHGNIMLDLAAFSPWAFDQRVTIVLFNSQKTYHEITGRPEWSGGATSVSRREIFVYKSYDLQSILAHELCHVYYDGFYLQGHDDPMWLSEGMAVNIQVERGLSKPDWLRPNLEILENGGGYSLKQLMNVTTLDGASDAEVQLWYAESYSVVRFLTRLPPHNGFYKFSVSIREGHGVAESLLAGYGMPYDRIQALEYAWRFSLAKSSLSRVGSEFSSPDLELNSDLDQE